MAEVLLLVAGVVMGAVAMHFAGRRRQQQLETEARTLRAALHDAESAGKTLEKRLALRGEKIEELEKQRDDYAAIASSHEVKQHEWRSGQWIRKVWRDRRYAGHPSDNLEELVRDFEKLGTEHVLVTLDLDLFGGWKTLLGGTHVRAAGHVTTPMRAGDTMLFEGPADSVRKQIVTFIRDDDTGFVETTPSGEKTWRDPDSPMTWRLNLDILEGYGTPPEVQYVEVLRVQKEIVDQ
jgi:uncharacterized membrane-anchored protein YhcB (DUF1043 family)